MDDDTQSSERTRDIKKMEKRESNKEEGKSESARCEGGDFMLCKLSPARDNGATILWRM